MPFFFRERKAQRDLAKEAERFAKHIRNIRVDDAAAPHADIRPLLAGFKKINGYLSQRTAKGDVPFTRVARVGREFQRMGASIRKRPTARTRPSKRRATRKR